MARASGELAEQFVQRSGDRGRVCQRLRAGRIGTVARTRVAGPVTTTSAASGIAASGGVSRSWNACMPSPDVHGWPAIATCQFPAPSLTHEEKPGV